MSGSFTVSTINGSIFTDSSTEDVLLRSTKEDKHLLLGVGTNNKSKLSISSGGVGIGTTNPLSELDLVGNLRVSTDAYLQGNVGIGTNTTGTNKLYVVGDTYTSGTIRSTNVYIDGDLTVMGESSIINTDVKVSEQFLVSNEGIETAVIIKQLNTKNALEVYNDNTIKFMIGNGGRIGINTLYPNDDYHIIGDSLLEGELNLKGELISNSNIRTDCNLTCHLVNNILLNYDVPDVKVLNLTKDTKGIYLTLSNVIQDNDGFGNLIPNINNINIKCTNGVYGTKTITASNHIETIKYVNIYSGTEETSYIGEDILNVYGLVNNASYTIELNYENNRGVSVNSTVISNVNTDLIGKPSIVRDLSLTSNVISYREPEYTDSLNLLNTSTIKHYKVVCDSVKKIDLNNLSTELSTNYTNSLNYTLSNLYEGELYKISVYARNISLDEYSDEVSVYYYTGFNSNNYSYGDSLITSNLVNDNTSLNYNKSKYYSVDCGIYSGIESFEQDSNNILVSSLDKYTFETANSNIRLYYNPNPSNIENIGIISMSLKQDISPIDTLNYTIKTKNNTLTNIGDNGVIGLELLDINSNNYFMKSKLKLSTNNSTNQYINYGYNKYVLNTKIDLYNFEGWKSNLSELLFDTTIKSTCNICDITLNCYYDNLKSIGNPSITDFGYNLTHLNKTWISGIPTTSNYTIDYAFNFNNIASYWMVNPLVKLENSNSSFNYTITPNNIYYQGNSYNKLDYNNTITSISELSKLDLDSGLSVYDNKILFREQETFITYSNILLSNISIDIKGYTISTDYSSNIAIEYIHNDSNSINHPNIKSNSNYGIRKFINSNSIPDYNEMSYYIANQYNEVSMPVYPSYNLIMDYNNTSNVTLSNYVKEAVLYNGYYYGDNTSIWKKNWQLIDNSSYNYTSYGINKTRWVLLEFNDVDGSSTDLIINIEENSNDDKTLLIKYIVDDLLIETVWFMCNYDYNGKNLLTNRKDGDGVRNTSKVDTLTTKNVKCIGNEKLKVYIAVGIPITNAESKFKDIWIS